MRPYKELRDRIVNSEAREQRVAVHRQALEDALAPRCPYKAEPEQWVAGLHAGEDGLVQCLLAEGHEPPHVLP
jgi:hypothetical protein